MVFPKKKEILSLLFDRVFSMMVLLTTSHISMNTCFTGEKQILDNLSTKKTVNLRI